MKQIQLFRGAEHPCSYLPGRAACSAYADPGLLLDVSTYSSLAAQGFRRSGDLVYRPHCPSCAACVPARIPVARFALNRSQQRNWRDNADVAVIPKSAEFDAEHYRLYQRYLAARHDDGGMADSSPEEYLGFLASRWADTQFVEFRVDGALLAVAVVDKLDTGLSAVYTFFDPERGERGLGTLAVLWQIAEARRLGLQWLYLGFWIEDCRKMNYKNRFRPMQALLGGRWLTFEKGEKIGL
jgi:arginine-tRNA-protein transferase